MNVTTSHTEAEQAVIWHDAECGGYSADLPLWRRLAEQSGGPVLEVGCGTGRVALDLARRGIETCAIDLDPCLIDAVRSRGAGLPIEASQADVLDLSLGRTFALIVAPMQVLQLLDGPKRRRRALERMRTHLLPGGDVAIALVEGAPSEAQAPEGGPVGTLPDVAERDGWVYSSLPLGVAVDNGRLVVRRLRHLVSPSGDLTESRSEERLDILSADNLAEDMAAAGFAQPRALHVPATDAHIGSLIVVAEVAS
jgi:SAM-dependent methyltransferase